MPELRKAPGMRERAPGMWELIVEAGRDPGDRPRRQVSRTFHGNLRDAKKARAELLVEVGKGRHTGTRATVDDLFDEWIVELRRKGRSPNTVYGYQRVYDRNIRPTLGTVAGDQGDDEDADRPLRRPPAPRAVGPQRVPDPRLPLVDVHPGVPVGLAGHEPGAVGRATVDPERRAGRADTRRGPRG